MNPDLVDIIHHALCINGDKCKRFNKEDIKGNTHSVYYQVRANTLMQTLGPIIGEENVPIVVMAVLDEVM
jgi:hypothetical protein